MQEFQIPEGFKIIPGFEDYAINAYANVIRIIPNKSNRVAGSCLHGTINHKGYRIYALYVDGSAKMQLAHRLVMRVYVGDSELQVNHIDGNKLNNHISNLEYCTNMANRIHAMDQNLIAKGSRIGSSKLVENQVVEIRYLHRRGMNYAELGRLFKISSSSVRDLIERKTWKHVP